MSDNEPIPGASRPEVQKTPAKIPRRGFLKLGAATAMILAAKKFGLGPEIASSPEKKLNSSALVLDFFDFDKFKQDYLHDNFPQGFSEEATWKEMGVDDPANIQGLMKGIPKNEEQAKLLLTTYFKHYYQDHGKKVITVMKKVDEDLDGNQSLPEPITSSIANAARSGNLEYDEIGNPTIHAIFQPEVIDELVSKSPESIVNMSFQMGDFSSTYSLYDRRLTHPAMSRQTPSEIAGNPVLYRNYQGNDISKKEYDELIKQMNEMEVYLERPVDRQVTFLDGYAGENTYNNLQKLTALAKKYPDKLFIAAGGNPTFVKGLKFPDIREARNKLTEQGLWPNNLLVVGFQGHESGFVGPASYGADIYVSDEYLEKLGFDGASSWATPVVSEVARWLVSKGNNTASKAKEGLMQMTNADNYWEGSEKKEYRVLDMEKAKNILGNRS